MSRKLFSWNLFCAYCALNEPVLCYLYAIDFNNLTSVMEFCKNLIGSLKKEVKCKHRLNIYHSKYFQSCQLSEIATLLAVVGSAIRIRNFFCICCISNGNICKSSLNGTIPWTALEPTFFHQMLTYIFYWGQQWLGKLNGWSVLVLTWRINHKMQIFNSGEKHHLP